MTRFETANISLQGDRGNNQDRCAVFSANSCWLLLMADGLGGHPKGEVAAQIALNVCRQMFDRSFKPIQSPAQFMRACIQNAHQAILEYGDRQHPAIQPRTTLVLALIQHGKCYWSHVGDSRFYLVRDAEIVSRSRDHSIAEVMEDLPKSVNPKYKINPNAVTRCLGGERVPPHSPMGPATTIKTGDTIILSSDGFWAQLEQQQIIDTLTGVFPLRKAVHLLANTAVKQGHPHSDNVTAVAFQWPRSRAEILNPGKKAGDNTELDTAIDHLSQLIDRKLTGRFE